MPLPKKHDLVDQMVERQLSHNAVLLPRGMTVLLDTSLPDPFEASQNRSWLVMPASVVK